jgi:hypothetical protein
MKINTIFGFSVANIDGAAETQNANINAVTLGRILFFMSIVFFFFSIKVGTASYPTAPSQIPACGFPAPGSSRRRAV